MFQVNYLDSFVVPRQNKRVSSLLFFLLGLTPSFIAARVLGFRKFAKKNKRLLAVYFDSEQSVNFNLSKFVHCDEIKESHNYVRVFLAFLTEFLRFLIFVYLTVRDTEQ